LQRLFNNSAAYHVRVCM